MYVAKLAMCVVLAGGVPREIGGSRVRGESHMLLVGGKIVLPFTLYPISTVIPFMIMARARSWYW